MNVVTSIRGLVLICAGLCFCSAVQAQTGVSDDRVSLPEGPGSLEGIGDNVSISPNMGLAAQSVAIDLPTGFPAVTPNLGLSYSSGGGSSLVGIGWDLAIPSIERMTSRGLPEYTDADLFAAGGGDQLVRISDAEPAVYRARFEGGFVRYKWFARGGGNQGYWLAEFPDGTRGYFGADARGNLVPEARVSGDEGTFRYMLVEKVDVHGHHMRYDYRTSGNMALPERISWLFDGAEPRYQVRFNYEMRPDVTSDAQPGFETLLQERLAGLELRSSGVVAQTWSLSYDESPEAGGISRLVRVERRNSLGELFPIVNEFTYSRAIGGVCGNTPNCVDPQLVDMGNLGFNFQSGNATLIDINGDALPDVVDTTPEDGHRFFLNQFRGLGDHTFVSGDTSTVGRRANHNLSAGNVQVIDADGDGYADMLNTLTGRVLENKGQGDWARDLNLFESQDSGLPDLAGDLDAEDGELTSIRFLDYDGDKRIDVIKSQGAGPGNVTQIFQNMGSGFVQDPNIEPLGVGFDNDRLQFTDINGDGLLDPVELRNTSLSYRLNLGRGRWGAPVSIEGVPFNLDTTPVQAVELEDLNNDAIADIVVVVGSQITYSLGQNGGRFAPPVMVNSETLGQSIPTRLDTTTVLYADMNANGSSDIVWIQSNGQVNYLDLFPVQPHLLATASNNLGITTTIDYTTVAEQAAAAQEAGNPWQTQPPFASLLVSQVSVHDQLSEITQITQYTYRDGFYDGFEKQFRGFATTAVHTMGDESTENRLQTFHYDLGMEDPYRAGLLLEETLANDTATLRTTQNSYEDCALSEIPEGLEPFQVRYICPTKVTSVVQEGAPEDQWVTTESTTTYDGYGGVLRQEDRGVVSIGGGGCEPCQRPDAIFGAPCGQQCIGDEITAINEYITPAQNNDLWILGRPTRSSTQGRQGGAATETLYYYDGPAFEGLPQGQLTRGLVTRVMVKADEGVMIPQTRLRHDEHGNPVESINPDGSPEVTDDRRTLRTYDETYGLTLFAEEVLLKTPEGEPYRLRQEYRYDLIWNLIAENTDWMVIRDGNPVTPRAPQHLYYDNFGRLEGRSSAANTSPTPETRITRQLQSPVSRILTESRSERGGPYDLLDAVCLDGAGRTVQTRVRIEEGRWSVDGLVYYNNRGQVYRAYAAYESESGDCDTAPPAGVPYKEYTYDAAGRVMRQERISDNEVIAQETHYRPLTIETRDAQDLDPEHPHFNTPMRRIYDGLGRQTSLVRVDEGGREVVNHFEYDETGALHRFIDPEGNVKTQSYDLASRLVEVDDPDRGLSTYTYNAAGLVTSTTNAAGNTVINEHDGLGRVTTIYKEGDRENTLATQRYDIPSDCPAEFCTFSAGQLVEKVWPGGTEWAGYGPRTELVRRARFIEGRRFDFSMAYDHALRLTRRELPGDLALDYTWDGAGRLVSLDGYVDAVMATPNGQLAELHTANGVRTAWDYDPMLRLSRFSVVGAGDANLVDQRFTYDALENLTQIEDLSAPRHDLTHNARFSYDALGRLTRAELDQNGPMQETMTYTYNDIDNLTAKTSSLGNMSPAHVGPMTYGNNAGPHAVTGAGDLQYTYDANGAMISRSDTTLSWDHLERLTHVRDAQGEVISELFYGPDDIAVQEKSRDGGTVWRIDQDMVIRDGVATLHVNMGGIPVARHETLKLATTVLSDVAPLQDPDGSINAGDAWVANGIREGMLDGQLEDTSAPLELLQASVARLLTEEGRKTFTHLDQRQTLLATTNAQGQLEEDLFWYPFGAARGEVLDPEARNFNSKTIDRLTGLINFGIRHYDPWLGRWASPDPAFAVLSGTEMGLVGEALGSYGFVGNNPIRYHDDDGQLALVAVVAIVGLSLAVAAGITAGIALYRKFKSLGPSNSSDNAGDVFASAGDGGGGGGSGNQGSLFDPKSEANQNYRAQKKKFQRERQDSQELKELRGVEGRSEPANPLSEATLDNAAAPASGSSENLLSHRSSLAISSAEEARGFGIGGEGETLGGALRRLKRLNAAGVNLDANLPDHANLPGGDPPGNAIDASGKVRRRSVSYGGEGSGGLFDTADIPLSESANFRGRRNSRSKSKSRNRSRSRSFSAGRR